MVLTRIFIPGALLVLCVVVTLPVWAQTAISADGVVESTAGGFKFPDGTVQTTAASPGSAPVEDTGQQGCWDASGDPISCSGTGRDGELQRGVDWPSPRFTDNLNGTVTDNLTGLIWLQNANCFGTRTWEQALSDANSLADPACSLTDGSLATHWRLPNIKELLSLVDYAEENPALPLGHPFTGVFETYWSSTTHLSPYSAAWLAYLYDGDLDVFAKANTYYVWPVRGGQ